jgi:polyisoprenoid-binding protein YceI
MNRSFFLAAMLLITGMLQAQDKYFTKTGKINFDATAPASPENITAVNKSVTVVMDIKTGAIQFAVLMKGFEFERALMQEHFNENYVESGTFPKAEFKGTIQNNQQVDYSKDGSYNVKVKGMLTMHGETREVEANGIVKVSGGKIYITSAFNVLLADYKITVPKLVEDKVGKNAKISIDCTMEPLKK